MPIACGAAIAPRFATQFVSLMILPACRGARSSWLTITTGFDIHLQASHSDEHNHQSSVATGVSGQNEHATGYYEPRCAEDLKDDIRWQSAWRPKPVHEQATWNHETRCQERNNGQCAILDHAESQNVVHERRNVGRKRSKSSAVGKERNDQRPDWWNAAT